MCDSLYSANDTNPTGALSLLVMLVLEAGPIAAEGDEAVPGAGRAEEEAEEVQI